MSEEDISDQERRDEEARSLETLAAQIETILGSDGASDLREVIHELRNPDPNSPTRIRDRVFKLAATDPSHGLELARGIAAPWFRCQALAAVAYALGGTPLGDVVLNEAFAAADEQTGEYNRIVSVAAWPLRVVLLSGDAERLEREIARLSEIIAQEASPVRRADALESMCGALHDAPVSVLQHVVEPFVEACTQPLSSGERNRRGESSLSVFIGLIARCDADWATRLAHSIQGPELRARCLDYLDRFLRGEMVPMPNCPRYGKE